MADSKKAFLLRIPPDLWESLRRWAREESRSLNAQIEYLLRDAVRDQLEQEQREAPIGSAHGRDDGQEARERPDPSE